MITSSQLLEDMTNYDKDKRFMAAIDLTTEISNNPGGLEINVQRKVCSAFLRQLDDQSVEVQGNAVKCLAKIMCRLDNQIPEVISKVSYLVLEGKPEVRDIYATCMKGLLSELPETSSTMVCQNVFPKMLQGISSPCNDIKEVCTDVLCDLLKRFGDNKIWWHDQEKITQSLLGLLNQQYKSSLRKKASACIGVLSSVSSDKQLDHICRVLFQEVRNAKTKQERQTYIQCIGTVSRNVGGRIGPYLENLPAFLIEICKSATSDVNMTDSVEDYEVVEISLNALESFIIRCPKEMSRHLDNVSELVSFLQSFDPNLYNTDEMSDQDMDSDEDLVDSEDDDSAWKVRRASLKCLTSIVKTADDDRLTVTYQRFVESLLERCKIEREDTVKLDSFTCFQTMITAAVSQKQVLNKAAHHLISKFPLAITAFQKQIRHRSLKIRQAIVATLRVIAEYMPHQLEPFLVQLQNDLLTCMKDKNNSIRLDAIHIIYHTASNYKDPQVYQQLSTNIFPILLEAVQSGSYYTIIASSLRTLGACLEPLRPDTLPPSKNIDIVIPLFEIIKQRLESTDIDQEVKERGLECLGQLLARVGDLPQCQEHIVKCLPPFVDRMRNEVTRATAIRAMKMVCESRLQVPIEPIIPTVIQYLCEYLLMNARSFRQLCLDCLVSLARKYGYTIDNNSHQLIIQSVVNYIADDDLYLTDLSIQIFINCFQVRFPDDQVLDNIVFAHILEIVRSPLLQGGALESILILLSLIAKSNSRAATNFAVKLADVSGTAQKNPQAARQIIATLARCLATIAVGTNGNALKIQIQCYLSVLGGPVDKIHEIELSTLALGEIGKRVDVSHTAVCDALLTQLNSPHDDLSVAAALALGMCSVGAMGNVLNTVIEQIKISNSKTQYLLLSSLREVIAFDADSIDTTHAATKLEPHMSHVLPILKQFATSSEEGVRHIVAECFGSLLVIHQQTVLPTLKPMMSVQAWEERMVAVSALRFAAKISRCDTNTLKPMVEPLIQCLNDPEISVRKSTFQSVNVMVLSSNLRELFTEHAENLLERCWIDGKPRQNLVREVDLGPFKHKVDDGLPLRKAVYNVATSLLAAYPDKITQKSRFMDFVLQGFNDGEDIQALSCQLVSDLCARKDRPEETVVMKLGELLDPFDRCITRAIKQIQAKQQVGRANDTLRLYVRTLKSVEVVAEMVCHKTFTDFVARLQKEPIFLQAYQGILTEN